MMLISKPSLKHLRYLSLIEGVSYILLILIGMPLKYQLGIMTPNKILGISHGILSIVFVYVLLIIWQKKYLNTLQCIVVFIASLIPFAAFVIDKKLKQKITQQTYK